MAIIPLPRVVSLLSDDLDEERMPFPRYGRIYKGLISLPSNFELISIRYIPFCDNVAKSPQLELALCSHHRSATPPNASVV
jgi:hypothetical protein